VFGKGLRIEHLAFRKMLLRNSRHYGAPVLKQPPFASVLAAEFGEAIMFMFLVGEAKFPMGQIVATLGALSALAESGQLPAEFIERHAQGDWGELCAEDCEPNKRALKNGARLFSRYMTKKDDPLYVITESDRSVTTILVPEEY
jgi:hypothetical protein